LRREIHRAHCEHGIDRRLARGRLELEDIRVV
jgi:hypothetical protein